MQPSNNEDIHNDGEGDNMAGNDGVAGGGGVAAAAPSTEGATSKAAALAAAAAAAEASKVNIKVLGIIVERLL